MFEKFRGWLRRTTDTTATRSYDSAGDGRRWVGQPSIANSAAAIQAARQPTAHRARAIVANNPLASSGVEAWVSALVATGIKPQSNHPDKDTKTALNLGWESWSSTLADMDGLTDIYGMQAIAARRMVVDGEAFILMINTESGLRLRLLDADQIVSDMHQQLVGGRVEAGIEFNALGERVAYHIRKDNPGQWPALRVETTRIDAQDVIHLFKQEVPGQLRGMSWLAPVLLRLANLDQWRDAQITRQISAASVTGFVAGNVELSAPRDSGELDSPPAFEHGAMIRLEDGDEVTFPTPPGVGEETIGFAKLTEHEIAAGLSIPYAVLTGDLSAANYSSTRAGLVEWRRRVEMIQYGTLVFMMLRRIYDRWALLEVFSGRINSLEPLAQSAKWITPKFAWVDPKKDAEAEILLIDAKLTSHSASLASRGLDIETVFQEIADDHALAKSYGFDLVPAPKPANDNTPPAADAA